MIFSLYLSIASRFHGGGFNTGPAVSFARLANPRLPAFLRFNIHENEGRMDWPRWIRSVVFALPYLIFEWPAFACAAVCKNIAHEDFWNMGTALARPDKSWLCRLVLLTGLKRDSLAFDTLGLAIKGALTAAGTFSPLLIAGHAISLPLAYYIGQRTRWGNVCAEYLSGAFYGFVIFFYQTVIK